MVWEQLVVRISSKRIFIYISWRCGLLSWKVLNCSLVLGSNDAFDGTVNSAM